jgi:hypothetical protein
MYTYSFTPPPNIERHIFKFSKNKIEYDGKTRDIRMRQCTLESMMKEILSSKCILPKAYDKLTQCRRDGFVVRMLEVNVCDEYADFIVRYSGNKSVMRVQSIFEDFNSPGRLHTILKKYFNKIPVL